MNRLCKKCGRMRDEGHFYKKRDGERADLCKDCLTMHVNNYNPETFLWILEYLDVPYVPGEWNTLRDRAFNKDHNATGGMTVIGKYLSKMKLIQYKNYGWADTEALNAERDAKEEESEELRQAYIEELKQKYENGEIPEAQYKTLMDTAQQNEDYEKNVLQQGGSLDATQGGGIPYYEYMDESEIDNSAELTQDEKIYLAMKWGVRYKPSEWIALEKDYKQMTESFDVQDADTINTLILICKTNLKMNQAIDSGDVEEYQKLAKVSESLRKSAKFTAAQNKDKQSDFIDSIGELVAYCEKNGGIIPRYTIEVPNDIVDTVIKDMKQYTKDLICEDQALAKQIEDYLKKIEIAKQKEADEAEATAQGLERVELTDEDYLEHQNAIMEAQEQDKEVQYGITTDIGTLNE